MPLPTADHAAIFPISIPVGWVRRNCCCMDAIPITLLVTDYAVAAGVLLAWATMKPQFVVLLLLWLAVWTMADWRRRYRWAVSFLATMTILMAASEWYLPHWIPRFWHAVREY